MMRAEAETLAADLCLVLGSSLVVYPAAGFPELAKRNGARLKGVGTTARHQIEALLGMRVYLDLHVSVAKDWQRDPKQLKKLGF